MGYVGEVVDEVLQAARRQALITDDIFEGEFWGNGSSAAVLGAPTFPRTFCERSVAFYDVLGTLVEEY